jgi:hypothetical protein
MRVIVLRPFISPLGAHDVGTTFEVGEPEAASYIAAGLVRADDVGRVQTPERSKVKLRTATKDGPNAGD